MKGTKADLPRNKHPQIIILINSIKTSLCSEVWTAENFPFYIIIFYNNLKGNMGREVYKEVGSVYLIFFCFPWVFFFMLLLIFHKKII